MVALFRSWGTVAMLCKRVCKLASVIGAFGVLAGCQYVGPVAIDQGRNRYNNIIQSTSKEQTLANIVRVYDHEPIAFMDVTEVDASQTLTGSITGGAASMGAHPNPKTTAGTYSGQVNNLSASGQYSESPTIRYQPLLGQALVAQMVTPVNADSLGLLYDSSWKVTPLLDLSASYLTLDYGEFYIALNIISELYTDGALEFVAAKSELTGSAGAAKEEPSGGGTPKTTAPPVAKPVGNSANDALDIYLQPFHPHEPRAERAEYRRQLQLWIRLLWLYYGTQPKFIPTNAGRCEQIGLRIAPADLRAWDLNLGSRSRGINLDEVRNCLPNFIELRTIPVSPSVARSNSLVSGAPLMRTYSALGILKNATERPHPKIGFVSADIYARIREQPWNQDVDNLSFYTLLPQHEGPLDNPIAPGHEQEDARLDEAVISWIEQPGHSPYVYDPPGRISEADFIKGNRRLGLLRRYILIVVDDGPPAVPPYVSYFDQGKWYYIAGDDEISQKNFDLVSLFLTMMAIPSALPPLAPVINVGG